MKRFRDFGVYGALVKAVRVPGCRFRFQGLGHLGLGFWPPGGSFVPSCGLRRTAQDHEGFVVPRLLGNHWGFPLSSKFQGLGFGFRV